MVPLCPLRKKCLLFGFPRSWECGFIIFICILQVLWSGNYSSVFEATMSLNRFRFLAANLRFDDQATRRIRWPGDRFAAMRWDNYADLEKKYSNFLPPGDVSRLDIPLKFLNIWYLHLEESAKMSFIVTWSFRKGKIFKNCTIRKIIGNVFRRFTYS